MTRMARVLAIAVWLLIIVDVATPGLLLPAFGLLGKDGELVLLGQ